MSDEKILHNKEIAAKKYFTMDAAIKAPIISKTAFIIANERMNKDRGIGRYYTVFPKFRDFLHNRHHFPNCHEIMIDHENAKTNIAGRLVFDFDIKDTAISPNFKSHIEDTIYTVVDLYFHDIDESRFEFVWSTSENPNKFSKHLTVKHLYFDNWLKLSDIFYKLFCLEWDRKYDWIHSDNLIDAQIVRQRASLRMVGSSKIGGYPLTLDDESHTLTDSLIRIYLKSERDAEQLVTLDNLNTYVIENVLNMKSEDGEFFMNTSSTDAEYNSHFYIGSDVISKTSEPSYSDKVYLKAFELINIICPGIFKIGKIQGKMLSLMRTKAAKCILSSRTHEHENAYLIINEDIDNKKRYYIVCFGCYRKCHAKKMVIIGYINKSVTNISFHEYFSYCNKKINTKSKISNQHETNDKRLKQIAHTIINI